MDRRIVMATLLGSAAWVSGCATGSGAGDASAWPPLQPGYGRVVFFRSSGFFGSAVSGGVALNGEVVGVSNPGKYFFVDRPAGNYRVAAVTEVVNSLTFTLAAGETKYVRTSPSLGLSTGRISVELEDPKKALQEVASLSHSGRMGR